MDKENKITYIDGSTNRLFLEISSLIGTTKKRIHNRASGETTLLFWKIGKRINEDILSNERAEYGKKIVNTVAKLLIEVHGNSFEARNLRRMMQFADQFPDFALVAPLVEQLKWSHFIEILPLPKMEAKIYYLTETANMNGTRNELRDMIKRKAYERREIADGRQNTVFSCSYVSFSVSSLQKKLDHEYPQIVAEIKAREAATISD